MLLNIEPEMHHVAILNQVFLAFNPPVFRTFKNNLLEPLILLS
jgi:hypothetical protein